MTTLAELVDQTEEHLMAGSREELNRLASTVDADDTTLTFVYDLHGIQSGAYLALDLEVLYVWDTDDNAKTATVERAMLGSAGATHTENTISYVNPRFSKWAIVRALNQELVDLSGPPNGIPRVRSYITTTSSSALMYPVPDLNDDLLDVLEVRWDAPGPEHDWPRVTAQVTSALRDLPTTGSSSSTSGIGIRIDGYMDPGRQLRVIYAAPYIPLVTLADDVATVAGLATSCHDILPLGAAARLMGVREAKRAFVEAEVDSRRAGEVPPGSAARAAQVLLALLNNRIRTEYLRFVRQYPHLQ